MKRLALLSAVTLMAASNYQSDITDWRQKREGSLKAENGWLTLTGLYWLHEGVNAFGRDAEIALEDGPAQAGTFELHHGAVTVTMAGNTRPVKPDSVDVVKAGRLNLYVI